MIAPKAYPAEDEAAAGSTPAGLCGGGRVLEDLRLLAADGILTDVLLEGRSRSRR
jgi:hypothetical protein